MNVGNELFRMVLFRYCNKIPNNNGFSMLGSNATDCEN